MKTLTAIAKELGVSVATVSYVYNGKWRAKRIRPDLAARVQAALEAAGAAPDALGRQLQSGRTRTVGVLLPHLEQPYMLRLLAGIERSLGEFDYMVLLGCAHWKWEGRQTHLLAHMESRRVDAIIMDPRPAEDLGAALAKRAPKTPLVFVDNYLSECAAARVLSDNRWGAREAVATLCAEGRRKVVFFGADPSVAALRDRYLGYCDALAAAGLQRVDSRVIWRAGREREAVEDLRGLLKSRARPDALFATSFLRLLPVLEVMDELGLKHPDDVMLAGFDQPVETWAASTVRRTVTAPLLAIVQQAAQIGEEAVALAMAALDGAKIEGEERLVRPVLSWSSAKAVGTING